MTTETPEAVGERLLREQERAERAERLREFVHLEIQRREAEEAARAREEARAAAQREAQHLSGTRDTLLVAVREQLQVLRDTISGLLEVDAELQNASQRAGTPFRSWRQPVAELLCVAARDAGLTADPVGFVPAAVRSKVLAAFDAVSPESGETEAAGTAVRCTVCASPNRDTIERALRDGEPLRTLEARFAVSRSALHRHVRDHLTADEQA